MSGVRRITSKSIYKKAFTGIFFLCVIASGIGSIFLSVEYFAVYDTANNFHPRVTGLEKSAPSASERLLIVDLTIANNGTRIVHIFGYGIIILLNSHQVAQRDTYEDIFLQPGQEITLTIRLLTTGFYAQQIIDAEVSGEWNWVIRHPMRLYVGGWLYVVLAYLATPWTGIEEVS